MQASDESIEPEVVLSRRLCLLRVRGRCVALTGAVATDRDQVKLRLEAQLGEVFVYLELIFSEAGHVRAKLHRQLIEHDVDLVISELFIILRGLSSLLERLVYDPVLLDLRVGLRDDRILDHFAAELEVLLRRLLRNLQELVFVVLQVEA